MNPDSQPVFFQGDAAWSIIAQGTEADFDTYLSARSGSGFNICLVNLIEHYYCTNAPNNINNDPPFTGANFTTPNEAYFSHADKFLQKADQYGVYVLLTPLYLGNIAFEGWQNEVSSASTGDMEYWGGYVGNRYKDYPNIIWVIGGDTDPTSWITKVRSFVTGLSGSDTNHTIYTAHNNRGQMAVDPYTPASTDSWLTLNDTYIASGDEISQGYDAYTFASPTMPYFNIEAVYENEGINGRDLRMQAYDAVLGGGNGHIFGNKPIWYLGYNGEDWAAQMSGSGSQYMALCGNFFRSYAWYDLVPDFSNLVLTTGFGALYPGSGHRTCAYDSGSALAITYMPSNTTMTFDMSFFTGTVTAEWFDPTDGSYTADAASPLSNTGTHDFSRATSNSAGDGDWVLVLSV